MVFCDPWLTIFLLREQHKLLEWEPAWPLNGDTINAGYIDKTLHQIKWLEVTGLSLWARALSWYSLAVSRWGVIGFVNEIMKWRGDHVPGQDRTPLLSHLLRPEERHWRLLDNSGTTSHSIYKWQENYYEKKMTARERKAVQVQYKRPAELFLYFQHISCSVGLLGVSLIQWCKKESAVL